MLDSKAYKEYYAVVFGAKPPKAKTKYKKKADKPVTSSKSKTALASKGSRLKSSAKVAKTTKKKQPSTMPKTKGLAILSEVALSEVEQIKLATKRSKKDFHMSHASGLGAGVKPEVPDVPKYASESDEESWTFTQDEDDADEETYVNDDSEETESNNDGDDLTYPNLSTYKADDEEEEEKKEDYNEVSSDHRVSDAEMTDAQQENVQANQFMKDIHVILTTVTPAVQHQSSSVSSDLVSKFINTSLDTGIDSIISPNIQSKTLVNVPDSVAAESPSSSIAIPQPPIPIIQPLQQTPESITTITIPTTTLLDIPNFASLF
nr:hypothetical protein [Tanacetum cinerariifolium]